MSEKEKEFEKRIKRLEEGMSLIEETMPILLTAAKHYVDSRIEISKTVEPMIKQLAKMRKETDASIKKLDEITEEFKNAS